VEQEIYPEKKPYRMLIATRDPALCLEIVRIHIAWLKCTHIPNIAQMLAPVKKVEKTITLKGPYRSLR
jgi:hypothetical protein